MNISKATKDTISITLVIGSNLTAVIKKGEGGGGKGGEEGKEKERKILEKLWSWDHSWLHKDLEEEKKFRFIIYREERIFIGCLPQFLSIFAYFTSSSSFHFSRSSRRVCEYAFWIVSS